MASLGRMTEETGGSWRPRPAGGSGCRRPRRSVAERTNLKRANLEIMGSIFQFSAFVVNILAFKDLHKFYFEICFALSFAHVQNCRNPACPLNKMTGTARGRRPLQETRCPRFEPNTPDRSRKRISPVAGTGAAQALRHIGRPLPGLPGRELKNNIRPIPVPSFQIPFPPFRFRPLHSLPSPSLPRESERHGLSRLPSPRQGQRDFGGPHPRQRPDARLAPTIRRSLPCPASGGTP